MQWFEHSPPRLPPAIEERETVLVTMDNVRLEARLGWPAGDIPNADEPAPRTSAVICHPDPAHGGSMDNKVVTTATRALAAAGIATLRFNFRGVGWSEGTMSGGARETTDVAAAVAALDAHFATGRRLLIGYSFGAAMAAAALQRKMVDIDRIEQLVLIAPPLVHRDVAQPPVPKGGIFLLTGDADTFCPLPNVRRFAAGYGDTHAALAVVYGANHFFHRRLGELARAIYQRVAG